MPFPRASKALARFTVLDLTRVRAGPTCARQLADWGANVIKIEAPPNSEEPMGGPRDRSDFQNLHRNKRSITLNLKAPEGLAAFKRLVEKSRRADREFPSGCEEAARYRLQDVEQDQSAPGLCQHFRLWPGWPLRRPAGIRPDRAGHGRPDVDHRIAGSRAFPRRHSGRRSDRGPVRRDRRSHRAPGAR